MASPDLHDEVILANLSGWKCAALGAFGLALGIPPKTMWIATAVLRSDDAPARLMTQVRLLIGQGMS